MDAVLTENCLPKAMLFCNNLRFITKVRKGKFIMKKLMTLFLALALAVPAFWPVWAALIVAGGIVVGKLGRKKGLETDDIYREVARELKHEAEAEAAREAAEADGKDAPETDPHFYMAKAHLFHALQVEKSKR